MWQSFIAGRLAALLLGIAGGALTAPLLGRAARPIVRQAIKGGIIAQREILRLVEDLREDLQDLTAEAKSELGEELEPPHHEHPHHHNHAHGRAQA